MHVRFQLKMFMLIKQVTEILEVLNFTYDMTMINYYLETRVVLISRDLYQTWPDTFSGVYKLFLQHSISSSN